jgi:hypothetical protein
MGSEARFFCGSGFQSRSGSLLLSVSGRGQLSVAIKTTKGTKISFFVFLCDLGVLCGVHQGRAAMPTRLPSKSEERGQIRDWGLRNRGNIHLGVVHLTTAHRSGALPMGEVW